MVRKLIGWDSADQAFSGNFEGDMIPGHAVRDGGSARTVHGTANRRGVAFTYGG